MAQNENSYDIGYSSEIVKLPADSLQIKFAHQKSKENQILQVG